MQVPEFFRKNPFLRLLAAYAGGLSFAYKIKTGAITLAILSAAACLAAIITCCMQQAGRKYRHGMAFGFGAFVFLFLAGIILGSLRNMEEKAVLHDYGGEGLYRAVIMEQPQERPGSCRAFARLDGGVKPDNMQVTRHAGIILYFQKDTMCEHLEAGSTVLFRTTPESVTGPLNPREFDYRQYLSDRKIWLRVWLEPGQWQVQEKQGIRSLKAASTGIRQVLLDRYRQLELTGEEYGVLAALTLGYKDELDAGTVNLFTKAGVLHVMALSGFNVGIIAAFFARILAFLSRKQTFDRIRIPLTMVAVWTFAWVTGLSPSVTRASVMLTFVLSGRLMARHISICNILLAAAFFILAWKPGLIADVGFQLSFTAVLGILFFQPLMAGLWSPKCILLRQLWQLFTVSCAAQLATLPLTIHYFNQFPMYFWLANLYVIPLVSCIICLSGSYLILSWIKPFAWLTGRVLAWSVRALLLSISPVEKIPGALLEGIRLGGVQTIILIFMLVMIGMYAYLLKGKLLLAALTALLAFLILSVLHRGRQENQRWMVVNCLNGISALNLISGHRSLLLADPDSAVTASMLSYCLYDFWIERGVENTVALRNPFSDAGDELLTLPGAWIQRHFMGENLFIAFAEKRLLWLKGLKECDNIDYRLRVDCLVVSGTVPVDLDNLRRYFDFPLLVIDSSNAPFRVRKWKDTCLKNNVMCWDVNTRGALCLVPDDQRLSF